MVFNSFYSLEYSLEGFNPDVSKGMLYFWDTVESELDKFLEFCAT